MLTNKYKRVPLDAIKVTREIRQRRTVNTEGLKDSIKRLGVIHPIVVTRDLELIAGERRLTACKELGLPDIPVRFADELSEIQLQIIELEENSKRQDLSWQDSVLAIQKLHQLYGAIEPVWTQERTADAIGLSSSHVSNALTIAREIDSPQIKSAQGFATALNIISRRAERAAGDAMSEIIHAGTKIFDKPKEDDPTVVPNTPSISQNIHQLDSILHANFIEWVEGYSGPRFNLLHCDFPYGINVFAGTQTGARSSEAAYDDSPDVYWQLIRMLCANLDKLMAPSAHMVFWFSMRHYHATMELFRTLAPSLDFNFMPIVWHKTDNVGIIPDAQRGPRQIYETALIASRGDRKIVKAVGNCYGAPTDRTYHASTKPEPMLRHFLSMFVDENTLLLDPTCGSGSAIRAAESLGAKYVLGLEQDQEHWENACTALKTFRALRRTK